MSVISPEDLCNLALDRIGYPQAIGSLYEGSKAARVAIRLYGETRDALLSEFDWPFARKSVSLGNPLKTMPVTGYGGSGWDPALYPPLNWIFSYAYPADCINMRSVLPVPIFPITLMPRVQTYAEGYDEYLGQKVVLTNLPNAQAIITARVTNPNEWQDSSFIDALVDRLASKVGKAFGIGADRVQLDERDAMISKAEASRTP
jgi:hypothetical protein